LCAFYILINAVTWEASTLGGAVGVWSVCGVSFAATGVLFLRWQRQVAPALAPSLDRPGTLKLAARRGAIVIIGLDSAEPGTTFLRLLAIAESLEYLALITTPQAASRGVLRTLIDMLARAGRPLSHEHVRIWDQCSAADMSTSEQAVTEAMAWMARQHLHASEIVVDVTKGRRPMHFGALIAASRAHVEVQYLAAEWHHLDDRPLAGTGDFVVVQEQWDTVGPDAAPVADD
jgi:hypothetical protein